MFEASPQLEAEGFLGLSVQGFPLELEYVAKLQE